MEHFKNIPKKNLKKPKKQLFTKNNMKKYINYLWTCFVMDWVFIKITLQNAVQFALTSKVSANK